MGRRAAGWKQQWHAFTAQEPGRRFRDRYERRRGSGAARSWRGRLLHLGGGVALLVIGAFFAVAPGPAVVFFALGGLLLANESYVAARVLDWIDVKVSPLIKRMQRHWRRLSPTVRHIATGCMVGGSVVGIAAGFLILR